MRVSLVVPLAALCFLMSVRGQAAVQSRQDKSTKTRQGEAATKSMTNADVIKMVSVGLSNDIVVAAVRNSPARHFDLSPSGLVALKEAGVSDAIISAMVTPKLKAEPKNIRATTNDIAEAERAHGLVVIPDGTEVHLRLLERVSSATAQVDDRLRFEAADDVKVNGRVVIAQGAQGYGTVIEAQHKKSFGRSGKLDFTIDAVKTIDGQNVRLRATKKLQGDEHYVKAGVVTYLAGPFGLMVKGKDISIEAGKVYTIYIDGDRRINLGS